MSDSDEMFLVAILSSMRPGGGDALQRAYRSAWRRHPEKRGDVGFLAQHLEDASVPGAYLGNVPRHRRRVERLEQADLSEEDETSQGYRLFK